MSNLKTSRLLSWLIVVLAVVASLGGLFLHGLYRDNQFVTSAWKGNDLVTLFLVAPLLVVVLLRSSRASPAVLLLWMGLLDYMLYNYAFYLFGASFNWFFLLYVALFGLSIFALIFGLTGLAAAGVTRSFPSRTRLGWVAGYMLLVALGLSLVYLAQSITFIVTGQLPGIVVSSGHPTSVVFALDMTLVIPFFALGAVWLLQRRPWGWVVAGISTVKGLLYTLVLTVGSLTGARAGVPGVGAEIPLWITLTVLGLLAAAIFYAALRRQAPSASAAA